MPYDEVDASVLPGEALGPLSKPPHALPRLAVVGEFSSGKSTLLNLLLGQDILPTRATATASPAVWLSHGEEAGYFIDAAGQRHPMPAGGIADVPADARYIRLWLTADFLESCEILDLSGLADPGRADDQTYQMLSHADCVIWCTPATQAWRQSERAAWLAVPEEIRSRSILAITRIDKLRQAEDLARVMRRVEHEAAGLFCAFAPISALVAQKALLNDDEEAWEKSGIDELTEALFAQLHQIREEGGTGPDRYALAEEEGRPAEPLADAPETLAEAEQSLIGDEASPDFNVHTYDEETAPATLDAPLKAQSAEDQRLILSDSDHGQALVEAEPLQAAETAPQPERVKPEPLLLVASIPEPEPLTEWEAEPEGEAAPEVLAEAEEANAPIAEDVLPEASEQELAEFDLDAFSQQLRDGEAEALTEGEFVAAPEEPAAEEPSEPSPALSATVEVTAAEPGQGDRACELQVETEDSPQAAEVAEPPPSQLTSEEEIPAAPPAATAASTEPAPAEAALIPGIEAALQRVLAGYFGSKPAVQDAPATKPEPAEEAAAIPQSPLATPPQEVQIWREIAAKTEVAEPLKPIVSMIDELLSRLFDPTQSHPVQPAAPALSPDLH